MHAGRGVLKSCHTLASWRKNGILDLIRKTLCFSFHCKLDKLLVNIIFLAELLDQLLVNICRQLMLFEYRISNAPSLQMFSY